MQPYIYMSVGIPGGELSPEDTVALEEFTEPYFYTEEFCSQDQMFAYQVLYNPWTDDDDIYQNTKILSVAKINELYEENRSLIIELQNLLKAKGLEHLVDKVDIVVHVTEI